MYDGRYYTKKNDASEGAGELWWTQQGILGRMYAVNTLKGALKQTGQAGLRALCEATTMAIYHCSVKCVKRSEGRSATAAAAYRSRESIVDERTGEIHDYTRRSGVESTELVFPDHVTTRPAREKLWNTAEKAETRKNAQVAREVEIALPDELTADQRRELAVDFARQIAERYNVAADVCIHQPGKEGDQRNHHAHILLTTRTIEADGTLGKKTRILDDQKSGPAEIQKIREMWAQICNASLEHVGHSERIDHRSLREQGEERQATKHQGPAVTAIERKNVAAVIRREHERQHLEHIISLDEYTQQRKADGNIPAVTRIGELNQAIRELERLEPKRPKPKAKPPQVAKTKQLSEWRNRDVERQTNHDRYTGCYITDVPTVTAVPDLSIFDIADIFVGYQQSTGEVDILQSVEATGTVGQPTHIGGVQYIRGERGDKLDQRRTIAQGKTWLNVPFKEKNEARKHGAEWDFRAKRWFAPEGTDLTPLKRWIPEDNQPRPVPAVLDPSAEFKKSLGVAGLILEGDPVMNGKIQRVPVVGGRPGAKEGCYCATMTGDRPNGWWQNHRTAEQSRWIYTAHILTDEAREILRQENAEKLAEREEERRKSQQIKQQEQMQEKEKQQSKEAVQGRQVSRDDDELEM